MIKVVWVARKIAPWFIDVNDKVLYPHNDAMIFYPTRMHSPCWSKGEHGMRHKREIRWELLLCFAEWVLFGLTMKKIGQVGIHRRHAGVLVLVIIPRSIRLLCHHERLQPEW